MTAGITFFLRSGFPFFTVAITMSPTQAEGSLLRRPLIPFTEMMYRFLAPVLSAQFTVAATGRPSDIRNLFPAVPPRPAVQSTFRPQNSNALLLSVNYSNKQHLKHRDAKRIVYMPKVCLKKAFI